MKQDSIKCDGEVTQEHGNSMFTVRLLDMDKDVLCTISGKIRKAYIKILVGDKVTIEMSPYDLTRGRISYRYPTHTNNNTPPASGNNIGKKKKGFQGHKTKAKVSDTSDN